MDIWGALKAKLGSMPESMAHELGNLGGQRRNFYKKGTKLGSGQLLNRGYRRMGYLGTGAVGAAGGGAYLTQRRSSARNGLQARSSGGY